VDLQYVMTRFTYPAPAEPLILERVSMHEVLERLAAQSPLAARSLRHLNHDILDQPITVAWLRFGRVESRRLDLEVYGLEYRLLIHQGGGRGWRGAVATRGGVLLVSRFDSFASGPLVDGGG
jgi:hypothetical protein